jgi:hypothetical protein
MMPLTQAEIKHIADESAKAALRDMLTMMGVDATDPKALLEMQQDFAHLRLWRESVETMRTKGLMVATGIIVTGVIGAIWLAIKGH